MKSFMDENFLLGSKAAQRLYHEYADKMPIFDYHCHLPPQEIADDKRFLNLTDIWLKGDHYKWRAMRTNGVREKYITGDASDREKFHAWASTVPYTIGNPLYHWTHLELRRYFGIEKILSPDTEEYIYQTASDLLRTKEFSVKHLLKKFNVTVICTTDDPIDSLEYHRLLGMDESFTTKVLPTFRPDKALAFDVAEELNPYLDTLSRISGIETDSFEAYIGALKNRHDFFHTMGCRISDHALILPVFRTGDKSTVSFLFKKIRKGESLSAEETEILKTAALLELGKMDAEKGWVMQLHFGALRNNNTRMLHSIGPDSGFDSIADGTVAVPLSRFLDALETRGNLPKTIIYTLNPRDNYLIGTMTGNFQGGGIPGKIQFGSGWWFNDQKDGMENQIRALANLGLLSRFVGMLTDSRSFLSYPRHEYFRRVLCNIIGGWIENGEAPEDYNLLGKMVQDISYHNAADYFGINNNRKGTHTDAS